VTEPLRPAHIDFSDAAAPRAPEFDDVYHARGGAFAQARHVFMAGNGLPQRWAGRAHFVILETGFGLGHNFLATWAAWRDDPARCDHLWFVSIDKHPPSLSDLRRVHESSPEPALARELTSAWPPLTPDLHRRDFAHGRVHLLLALGDVATWLPQCVAAVDAIYLDGFAPAKNPSMWQPALLKHLGRLAADGATAATWSSARLVRDALAGANFDVQRRAGFDGKRDMLCAVHAPRHRAPRPAGRRYGNAAGRIAIVGAGLAGAAMAFALARLGIGSLVLEAASSLDGGNAGQPAGLLHGVVHGDDSPHTRWFRAAALHAHAALAPWLADHRVHGSLSGLLRIERALELQRMHALLAAQGLPPDYVQALGPAAASERAGCTVDAPAWLYADGGWIDPPSLVRAWLDDPHIELHTNTRVQRIEQAASNGWRVFDDGARCLADVDHLVLANGDGAAALLPDAHWPLQRSRGQVTLLRAAPHWRPALPLAGDGYAIALPDGGLLCGATRDVDDDSAELRDADHRRNLDALQRLSGRAWPAASADLGGRVGWRLHARDRLPLIGGVALPAGERAGASRQDQPRFIARRPGLHVLAAFGSRGLTQATLAAELLAAMITGTPAPVGATLLDAVDAARFDARAARTQ
jgi:tRNA 5-methylaminomethyl-2-thiouridine biosynthesis bifunctional protein